MKGAVIVFAKVPLRGNPKSRIAEAAGRAKADAIYDELLKATAKVIRGFPHFVSFFGHDSPGDLKRYFPGAEAFIPQEGETLGLRVRNSLAWVHERGYSKLCAVGTDCPYLARSDIERAFQFLEQGKDVAVGPAEDGGYYFIAVKDPDCGVFHVTGWSTADLLRETLDLMDSRRLSYVLLEEKRDIDTLEDYGRWISEIGEA